MYRLFLLYIVISSYIFAQEDFLANINIYCPHARKVAPNVTAAFIVRVISAKGGIEDIYEGQEIATRKHSSQGLKVVTAVCGQGGLGHDFLLYGGAILQPIKEQDIDSNNDGISDGFLILWDMDNKGLGGTLVYKAHSANARGYQEVRLRLPG